VDAGLDSLSRVRVAVSGVRADRASDLTVTDELPLADEFENELLILCDRWDGEGINSEPIREGIARYGAVQTAAFYVKGFEKPGFRLALQALGVEATVEGLVVSERFRPLFDADVVVAAEERIASAI
jgi:hypothetical protein